MKFKFFMSIIGIFIFLLLINHLSKSSLIEDSMISLEANNCILYFNEKDLKGAEAILQQLERDIPRINRILNFHTNQKVKIYIYENQKIFQRKKYGLISYLFNLNWYIGDNIKDNIIIVSPLNPGSVHTFESIVKAVSHEYVHAILYKINSSIPLWLNEGIALYLTNGSPFLTIKDTKIPTYKETQSNNPIIFANANGYGTAHTYIEFLSLAYDFDSIIKLINSPKNYIDIFGCTDKKLYENWLIYLNSKYQ